MQSGHCWGVNCKYKTYEDCLRAQGIDPVQNAKEIAALESRAGIFKDLKDVYGDTWRVWPGKD